MHSFVLLNILGYVTEFWRRNDHNVYRVRACHPHPVRRPTNIPALDQLPLTHLAL